MAESYIDPNLLSWQKSNVDKSLESFQQHTADLKARREKYEKSNEDRQRLIGVAEGLAEHFAPQGEAAPSYIHKFLKKAETNGGVHQMSTVEIGKFLGMHGTVEKQKEIEMGTRDKESVIALRDAQTRGANATTAATLGGEKRVTDETKRADALRDFLSQTAMEDIGKPTRQVTTPTGVGVQNVKFRDPRTGQEISIDQSAYAEIGLDENGQVIDKDAFSYASSLTATELASITGAYIEPNAEVNINAEVDATRARWRDVMGMEPESIFDKGGSRKDVRGADGTIRKEPDVHENHDRLIKAINHNPKLFPNGVPATYKGRNVAQGYSATGQGRKTTLTVDEADALQEFVVDTLAAKGYEDLATVGKLVRGHREIAKAEQANALMFEKKMVMQTTEQLIDDQAELASIRYDKVAARWKAQNLPPPMPKAAYIAASVPELTRVIPQVDEFGRPTGAVKTYVKLGDAWKDVTAEKTMPSAVDSWKNTEAQGKENMLNFNGQYGSIVINGRATAFDEKGVSDLSDALNDMDAFNENMDLLKELYSKHNFVERLNPTSAVRAQIKGLIGRTQPMIRKIILGTGVVTEPDQSRLNALFRDPDSFETWFNDPANIAEFEATKGVLEQKAIALLNKHKVVQPDGKRGYMVGGKGNKGKAKALELLAVNERGYKLTPADVAVIKEYNPSFGR